MVWPLVVPAALVKEIEAVILSVANDGSARSANRIVIIFFMLKVQGVSPATGTAHAKCSTRPFAGRKN